MGRDVALGEVEGRLAWLDPRRDASLARSVARRLLDRGGSVSCVWTGESLGVDDLDVDHCLPWSACSCGDLWHLMPSSSRGNQRLKRDRLPSGPALAAARERVLEWWQDAWFADVALRTRFELEATAALPVERGFAAADAFAALEWRRMRLRRDQQVKEWAGARRPAAPARSTSVRGAAPRAARRDGRPVLPSHRLSMR